MAYICVYTHTYTRKRGEKYYPTFILVGKNVQNLLSSVGGPPTYAPTVCDKETMTNVGEQRCVAIRFSIWEMLENKSNSI